MSGGEKDTKGGKGKGGTGKGGKGKGGKKEKYAKWQKDGQKVIQAVDSWLTKHTYVEGTASLKSGTYVDIGIKNGASLTLGEYQQSGYLWSNQDGLQKDETHKWVMGGSYFSGANFSYDDKNKVSTVSMGYGLFIIENTGTTYFIGFNPNISFGIGIGGEAGGKVGLTFDAK